MRGGHKTNNSSSLTSVTQREEEDIWQQIKRPKKSRQKNKLDNSENSQGSSFQDTVSVKVRGWPTGM